MAILSRITRLFRADLHGVMDQLEDSDLLLKQYIREMEQALADKQVQLSRAKVHRDRLRQERERYTGKIEGLESDVTAAVVKSRDDIARKLIRKRRQFSAHHDDIAHRLERLDQEIEQLQESYAEQRLQFDQLKLEAAAHIDKMNREKWAHESLLRGPLGATPGPSPEEVELELIKRKEALKESPDLTS